MQAKFTALNAESIGEIIKKIIKRISSNGVNTIN